MHRHSPPFLAGGICSTTFSATLSLLLKVDIQQSQFESISIGVLVRASGPMPFPIQYGRRKQHGKQWSEAYSAIRLEKVQKSRASGYQKPTSPCCTTGQGLQYRLLLVLFSICPNVFKKQTARLSSSCHMKVFRIRKTLRLICSNRFGSSKYVLRICPACGNVASVV